MSTTTRHYLVEDGTVRPVTRQVMDDIRHSRSRLPQFAGRPLRLMKLTVELEAGKPVAVRDVETEMLQLDDKGRVDRAWVRDQLTQALRASVQRRAALATWRPTRAEVERATALALRRAKSPFRRIRPEPANGRS